MNLMKQEFPLKTSRRRLCQGAATLTALVILTALGSLTAAFAQDPGAPQTAGRIMGLYRDDTGRYRFPHRVSGARDLHSRWGVRRDRSVVVYAGFAFDSITWVLGDHS